MYTIRKKFKFEMAHLLTKSYSKECQQIHGHSYVLEVFVTVKELNGDGVVIDFGKLKSIVAPIVREFDHECVVEANQFMIRFEKCMTPVKLIPYNPTAENMARDIWQRIVLLLGDSDEDYHVKVRLHETDTGYAEYEMKT